MTLLETIKLIEYIASQQININTIVETENIYDLNNNNFQIKYSAFCLQQQRHVSNVEGFITFNFNAYYVDRLTNDKTNKLHIQSTGINILNNIINTIKERVFVSDVSYSEFITFTERFTAECAGVYCSLAITVPVQSLCSIYADESGANDFNNDFNNDFGGETWSKIGDFGPDFSDDFSVVRWQRIGDFNDDFNDDFWVRNT